MTIQSQPDPLAQAPNANADADEPTEETPVAPSNSDGFRLGGEPPRVMRLSRKALATLGFVASLGIGGSLIYALQPKDDAPPANLIDTNGRNRADQVTGAPASYSDVPNLGPSVTEDGERFDGAQMQGSQNHPIPPVGPPEDAPPPPDPRITAAEQARERAAQERDSAIRSQLFLAASNRGGDARTEASTQPVAATAKTAGGAALTPAATPSSRHREFLEQNRSRRMDSSERILRLQSPHVVQAGSIIPAALITGIRSDLPGQITAQVTQNVYDSPTGRILLIPQGSRLIGEYDSDVAAGQNRVLLAWDRLILPGGNSVALDRMPGADAGGMAGLEDRTNYHWGNMLKAALISTLLGAGTELVASNDSDLVRALRFGTQDTVNQTGRQVVQRQLNVPPTLTVRPGFALRIIVTRDLILEPFDPGVSQ
ncbi:MAG: conjugal transfer protein TraI [Blastomonas fulva]|uniref:TrbI/VirB10 family protein n=1 Tax=Blastomonas fulva TaxID=1550728 RepID=UPI0024E1B396|nr:TrbI/VirB10 family protein [Blastomonas fulva]MDK2756865.1 conjugal transfer protein TraI [Blastomonas fulva]